MKRGSLIAIFLIFALMLFIGSVSASWYSDIWHKVTGKATADVEDCIDSDGGLNYKVRGECTDYHNATEIDFCDEGSVWEQSCGENNRCTKINHFCPYGCEDGACLPACNDNEDGGRNLDVRGTLTSWRIGGGYDEYTDVCHDDWTREGNTGDPYVPTPGITGNYLIEYSCYDDDTMEYYIYSCESRGDYWICENGSCKYNRTLGRVASGVGGGGAGITPSERGAGGGAGEAPSEERGAGGGGAEVPSGTEEEFEERGFLLAYKYADWKCLDDEEFNSHDNTSCKPRSVWKQYAEKFCEEHGGIDKFELSNECYTESVTIAPSVEEETIEEGVLVPLPPGEEIEKKCDYGCVMVIEDKEECLSLGYRLRGKYCSLSREMLNQLSAGESCENNFECKSNACMGGECISKNLLLRILNWFRRLFE